MKKINRALFNSYVNTLDAKEESKPNNIDSTIENIKLCFEEFSKKENSGCIDCDSPGCIDCEKLGITTHELEILYNIYARTKNNSKGC